MSFFRSPPLHWDSESICLGIGNPAKTTEERPVKPITELDVAKGIQFQLADLDLNHPHAREACLGLMSSLERSLDLIRRAAADACLLGGVFRL